MTPEALEMSKKSAARVMKLEKEVAALTKDKEDAWELIEEFRHENSEQRCQLAAAQATNERLRDRIAETTTEDMHGKVWRICCCTQAHEAHADHCILALPNDTTALDARLAQERKEIADTCDRFHERGMTPAECAAHIRSMT